MPQETPVDQAASLLGQGLNNQEVTRRLEEKGYNLQQISDAINQANIKKGVVGKMPESQMQESSMGQEIPLPQDQQAQAQQAAAPQQAAAYQQQAAAYAQQSYYPGQQGGMGDVQAIVEQIVEEKWREMVKGIGDMGVFKARVSEDMESVKQELLRTQKRLEDLQVAVMGKVKDYHSGVAKLGTDMQALEQVFAKILEPLTMNIKELGRITHDLKDKHKRK
jgi:hypothetical protein